MLWTKKSDRIVRRKKIENHFSFSFALTYNYDDGDLKKQMRTRLIRMLDASHCKKWRKDGTSNFILHFFYTATIIGLQG